MDGEGFKFLADDGNYHYIAKPIKKTFSNVTVIPIDDINDGRDFFDITYTAYKLDVPLNPEEEPSTGIFEHGTVKLRKEAGV